MTVHNLTVALAVLLVAALAVYGFVTLGGH
jgi:hypothetical protein